MKKIFLIVSLMLCMQSMNAALEACQTIGETVVTGVLAGVVGTTALVVGAVIDNPIKSICCIGGLIDLRRRYKNLAKSQDLISNMILERNKQSNYKQTKMGSYIINNPYQTTISIGTDAYCVDNARVLKNGTELKPNALKEAMNAHSLAKCLVIGLKALCCYGLYTVFAK